ncbi:MAG: hypothetical protein IJR70_04970 [Eubacterium sp.]|nr:hypothetical protein [Eubacterium sp.]
MKRSFLIVFLILLFTSLINTFTAYAKEDYLVYSDKISAQQGETVTVPLKISGNKGLMGFRITVKYPDSVMKLTDVSSGSLTNDGLFNTTVTSYEGLKGEFDILWSDSKEVEEDGTLAVLTYQIKPTADNGKYDISLNYSKDDTFNGKYEDASLKCSPIKITVGKEEKTTKAENKTEASIKSNNDNLKAVSDDYLVSSVNEITHSFGKSDIELLNESEQKAAVEYVNNRVETYDENAKKYSNFEELKNDYYKAVNNEAVRRVLESTDDSVIAAAKNEVLKEYGASSFKEIPKENKKEANEKMLQKLKDSGADLSGFENITDEETAAEKLDEIVSQSEQRNKETIDIATNKNNGKKSEIIISVVAVSAIVLAIVFLAVLFKKRR